MANSNLPYQAIGAWQTEAGGPSFQLANMLITHHMGLVVLVLVCSHAQSLEMIMCVTIGVMLWIVAPYLLMRLEMKHNPHKYDTCEAQSAQVYHTVVQAIDKQRALLGVHRFFVSQDSNGDMRGGVKGIVSRKTAEAAGDIEELKKKAMYDWKPGMTGFQAMLGHSVQLHTLHWAVLLLCVADMVAMGASDVAFTGGDVELMYGDDSLPSDTSLPGYMRSMIHWIMDQLLPIHASDQQVETSGMLCGVLLYYAYSIRVPTALTAHMHRSRVDALERSTISWGMRERTRKTGGKVDERHKAFLSSQKYQLACRKLPQLLVFVRVVGFLFCAEDGCHVKLQTLQKLNDDPFTFVSTFLFGLVEWLTMITLHDWVILEFTRAARIPIYRLQSLTQELREAINKFDDLILTSVGHDDNVVIGGQLDSYCSHFKVLYGLDAKVSAAAVAVAAVAVAGTLLVVAATALALDASVIAATAAGLFAVAVAVAVAAAAWDFFGERHFYYTGKDGAIAVETSLCWLEYAPDPDVDADVRGKADKLVASLRAWLHTRIFMQRHDISLFFNSVEAQVGPLILCMAGCVVRVLLHFFGVLVFAQFDNLVGVVLAGVWCICIVYFQTYYILKMDLTTQEQLRMLRQLSLWVQSKTGRKEAVDTVSFVLDHVLNQDEPPTLLGVRVDRTLINLLHKSVAVTIAGWALSAISKRFF